MEDLITNRQYYVERKGFYVTGCYKREFTINHDGDCSVTVEDDGNDIKFEILKGSNYF